MTHETYILQEHRHRARWANGRWVNLNYFDTIEEAEKMAKFYEEKVIIPNYEVRIKVKDTNKVIYQTGC